MTKPNDRAQIVWELARVEQNDRAAASWTRNTAVLHALATESKWAGAIVAGNPATKTETLTELTRRYPAVAPIAALHRNCEPRTATKTIEQTVRPGNLDLISYRFAFLPPAALAHIDRQIAGASRSTRTALSGAIAVANNGTVVRHTSAAVRRWLETRTPHTLTQALGEGATLTQALIGREDLSDEETLAHFQVAGRDGVRTQLAVLAHRQVTAHVAETIIDSELGENGFAGELLVELLRGRERAEQSRLIRLAADRDLLTARNVRAMWRTSDFLLPLAAELQAALGSSWSRSSVTTWTEQQTLDRPLQDALDERMAAPETLGELNDTQLDAFAALAANWQGSVGQLLDVLVRVT